MGNRKEKVREGLGKEGVALRCVGMGSNGIWSGDMGLKGEEADRKNTGEVSEVANGGGLEGYLIREELQREKMRVRAGRRARRFEERLAEGKGSAVTRRCWEEMRRRARAGGSCQVEEREARLFKGKRGRVGRDGRQ